VGNQGKHENLIPLVLNKANFMPLLLELQIKKPLTNMDQALKASGPICSIKMFLLEKI